MIRWAAILILFLIAAPHPAAAERVALTFDDLPTLSLSEDPAYATTTTRRLLADLRRERLPAIGFVVGDKFEDTPAVRAALLGRWIRAGVELGNHTYSHGSPNKMGAEAYIADIARDDALLRQILAPAHRTPRWFRHPYLETGPTLADQRRIEAWLAANGYRIAPVTVVNSDDQFALPYDEAILKGDRGAAAAIQGEYLAYTAICLDWYRKAALELLGRRPDLVMLLHASRLNADSLGDLAAMLRTRGLTPSPLDVVMRDPAYAIAEVQADANGDDWLERWSVTLKKDLDWTGFQDPPADVVAATARLDTEP
ncbi:polysaccharide deacetylase family protein [Phenylobacterium soli]|uniref:Chitooligosaccharide deacetylase n=1 Tax=Phenylobacterium soli TaxID=2170551 RepID=A0A328AQ40_9CAUL|nr:polysaccharide deacetylase family protein [Phenylobacterium soli]RAK55866.1 polysaccharide deacetylase [Phenylobacterium soli]